ncbi:hypothetical protein [Motilimonas cestriensis]|uniref:hypothetical protein n=1 Tax=Motilimonas cestriensis TaxID=2742685 RepID=UPI003DA2E8DD
MYIFSFELSSAIEFDAAGNLFYLSIKLVHCSSKEVIELTSLVIESDEQFEWFEINENEIRSGEFPIQEKDQESIALTLSTLTEESDPDDLELFEKLYDYRSKHALSFAFRGQDVADIFVAKNFNRYEVSCVEGQYNYEVDIDSLFIEVANVTSVLAKD